MRKDFIVFTGICLFSGLLSFTGNLLMPLKPMSSEVVKEVNKEVDNYYDIISYCEDNYICEEVVFAMHDFDSSNSLKSYAKALNKLKNSYEINDAIVTILDCSYEDADKILLHSSEMEKRKD